MRAILLLRYGKAIHRMTLERWLKTNSVTEVEAARRLQVPQSALNRITFSKLPPQLRTAAKIVRATDGEVTYEDLLGPIFRRTLRRYNGRLSQVAA